MNFKGNHLKGFWTKKKILFVSLLLVATLGIGVTTAYMWKKDDTQTHQFTNAVVDCEVYEDTSNNNNVNVKNTGNVPCYVRVTFTVNFVDNDGKLHYISPISNKENSSNYHYKLHLASQGLWEQGTDGYWYYTKPLMENGESTEEGLVHIVTTGATLQPPNGYTVKTKVTAEAVQALPEQYATMTKDPAYIDAWLPTRGQQQVVPTEQIADLKVMSFNIRRSGLANADGTDFDADSDVRDWAKRKDAVVNYIFNQNADIIILQEVTIYQRNAITSKILSDYSDKYSYTHYGYRSWWYGIGESGENRDDITGMMIVFNTNKLQKLNYGTLTATDQVDYGNGWQVYQEEIENNGKPDYTNHILAEYYSMRFSLAFKLKNPPQGTPEDAILFVHDMHLDYNSTENQTEAAKELMNEINTQKKTFPNSMHLVAGTFNSELEGSVWKDTLLDGGLFNCGKNDEGETLNSWTIGSDDLPLYAPTYYENMGAIDFVFGQSEHIRSEGFTVDRDSRYKDTNSNNQYLSSHYPLIGRITCYAPLTEN